MRHSALLDRADTALLVIDVQESYRTVLPGWDRVIGAIRTIIQGAALLDLPILATEQYPRGLGHTAPEVSALFPPNLRPVEKRTMSCCGGAAFVDQLGATGRRQVLIVGIETHACVNQTAHDLLAAGYQVHVARDATGSRRVADAGPAWEKMRSAGMLPTTSEQALLELVRTSDVPEFRAVQRLLKEAPSSWSLS
jgi:nicotinamidase-related amidase